jgi:signal transduction histidine kinase
MRLKFFFVTATIVFVMISVFCGAILISTRIRNTSMANDILERTAKSLDRPDGNFNFQLRLDMRVFAVRTDSNNAIVFYYLSRNYTEEEMQTIIANHPNNYKFFEHQTANGKIIVGMDTSIDDEAFNQLTLTVLFIGGGALLILLVLVWFLSFWIVRPAEQSLEKQRRFTSEASHELKTPLTVVSTGIELLQGKKQTDETKKWLDDIKRQTERMAVMTNDLLTLSKLDETKAVTRAHFNISQVTEKEILAMEGVACEQGKQIECDIEKDLIYNGDTKAVIQAVTILCDNAIKHSAGKEIKVTLKKDKRLTLTVSNKSDLGADELPYIFERFYRGKEARAKASGTGLGMSILKTLADKNNWKLKVNIDFQCYFNISVIF